MAVVNKEDLRAGGAIKRRTFLQGVCGMASMVGLGRLANQGFASTNLLRPPGGQDEAWFLASCLKCNKCVDVCPTEVVALGKVTDGILQARTPILNFHLGYCTFCGKCVDVCPSASLKPLIPNKARLGIAQVNRDRCIAWQMVGCTKCKVECGYEAIGLDMHNRPIVDESKCNGCGKCEFICPSSQLGSYRSGNDRGIIIVNKK